MDPSPSERAADDPAPDATPAPDAAPAAVYTVAPAAVVAGVFLALCVSPIAFQGGAWFALFLLPVALVVAVLRVRTTVDTEGLHVRTLTTTTLSWSEVATLRLTERSWVRAVPVEGVRGGRELLLVNVRIQDLGRVGEASGGRIAVPTPAEAEAAEEHRRELEAARIRIAQLRGDDGGRPADDGATPDADTR